MVLRRRLITGFLVTGIAALFMFLPCQGLTQEDQAERPERQVNMAPEYPGVIIPLDEDEVSMDLVFANKGKSDEDLDVWIDEQPQGWEAAIKTYAYEISAIHVPEGEDKSLTFEAVPGDDVQPGSYRFVVKAEIKDSRLQLTRAVTIRVLDEQTTDDGSQALALTTSYPVIRGPSDASFKFSVDVESKLEDDAVDHVSFEIRQGEIFGFLGPNGAGKTTTLLMLLGLTEPSSGFARILDLDPAREPIKVKSKVGYLQENMGFYSDLNARQMLMFVAELNGISGRRAEERINLALEVVGLLDESDKKIGAYSRGMRQRLGLAELLIKDAQIAFLDEPTLGLDPEATNRMIELIQSLCREQQMTVLLSSHLLQQVQKICHRVGIMIKGRMVAQGPLDQLAKESFGIDQKTFSLEDIYMNYFQEA
jgi:ABC-2 type transport system ATP-binding protein